MPVYSKNLKMKLWDILQEGNSDVIEYLQSINDGTNSSFVILDEVIGDNKNLLTDSKELVGSINELKGELNLKADKKVASTLADGLMSVLDKTKLDGIQTNANNYTHPTTHSADMITGLANIAKTGNYNDLSGKPTIPNVANKLEVSNIKAGQNITVAVDGNNVTINSTGSGSGDVTESQLNAKISEHNASSTAHSDIRGIIPTRLGQLTNDSGYLTELPQHNHDEVYFNKSEFEALKPTLKGDKGDKGDVGESPRLAIGKVTTLTSDEDATIEVTGTPDDIILNFGIPQGKSSNSEGEGINGNKIIIKKWKRE